MMGKLLMFSQNSEAFTAHMHLVSCLGSGMSQVPKSFTETDQKNRSIHGVDITAMNTYVEVQVWTNSS